MCSCCQSKYLFQNYKQSSQYRSYKKFVQAYLHDRPHSVILHFLERKSKSAKYAVHSVHDVDSDLGIFEIKMKKQDIQSSLEHLMTCLLVHAKIGCGTTSLAKISLPSSHTEQTGHVIGYPVHIRTVHTYQWTHLPWTHSPCSHHHIHQLLGQVRNAAMDNLLGRTVMITSNKEQSWNGNTIDLLTDHRSLHLWLYKRSIFCHKLNTIQITSGVSQQQLAELAIVSHSSH